VGGNSEWNVAQQTIEIVASVDRLLRPVLAPGHGLEKGRVDLSQKTPAAGTPVHEATTLQSRREPGFRAEDLVAFVKKGEERLLQQVLTILGRNSKGSGNGTRSRLEAQEQLLDPLLIKGSLA
jgi:hypothetical protein